MITFADLVPVVVVFTQYDRLVRTKKMELEEDDDSLSADDLKRLSEEGAKEAFDTCIRSFEQTMHRLKLPMPPYLKVSGALSMKNAPLC